MTRRGLAESVLAAVLCVAGIGGEARAIVVSDPTASLDAHSWQLIGRSDVGFINHSGVASIAMLDGNDNVIGRCSGSLLTSGQHVLSAAHCITNPNPEVSGVIVTWELPVFDLQTGVAIPGLTVFVSEESSEVNIHPAWEHNPNSAAATDRDLAVITLPSVMATAIGRFDILRDTSGVELSGSTIVPGWKVGYGVSGFDGGGAVESSGDKHWGLNAWDQFFQGEEGLLQYDFDSGLPAQNSLGGLGFGNEEGAVGRGDSGGPTIIDLNGNALIAGVASFFRNGGSFDTNPQEENAATEGDTAVDVRVSDPLNQNFIDLLVNHDRLLGDTNNDGTLDSLDIDTLFDAIGGVANPWFDLNLDSVVDTQDVDALVLEVFQTDYGDLNLDGQVSALDFDTLISNLGEAGGWADGDLNGSDSVSAVDFGVVVANLGFTRDTSGFGGSLAFSTTVIPEPTTASLLALAAVGLVYHRRG